MRPFSSNPSAAPVTLTDAILVETIRQTEAHWGPVNDEAEVRRSLSQGGSFTARLSQRARFLAEREGHFKALQQLRYATGWLVALWLGLGVIAGGSAAYGLLRTPQLNVLTSLAVLVGVNLLTFTVWLLWTLTSKKPMQVESSLLLRTALRLLRRLVLRQGQPALPVLNASVTVLTRAGLLRWLIGILNHGFWLAASLSALAIVALAFSLKRYGFNWETTLLTPQGFEELVQVLSTVPSWLGLTVPSVELIQRSDGLHPLTAAQHRIWSQWLLACVVAYGVLPRLLGLSACLILWQRHRGSVYVDESLPGLAEQRDRLLPTGQGLGVDQQAPADYVVQRSSVSTVEEPTGPVDIAGIEWATDVDWPPRALPSTWHDHGRVDSRPQRQALIQALQTQPPQHLVLMCPAAQTPDRGVVAWLVELSQYAPSVRVVLWSTNSDAALTESRNNWQRRLLAAGFQANQITNDLPFLIDKTS